MLVGMKVFHELRPTHQSYIFLRADKDKGCRHGTTNGSWTSFPPALARTIIISSCVCEKEGTQPLVLSLGWILIILIIILQHVIWAIKWKVKSPAWPCRLKGWDARGRVPLWNTFFSGSHTQFFYTFAPAGIIMTLNYAWGWLLAVMATLDWAVVHTPMDDRMMVSCCGWAHGNMYYVRNNFVIPPS